MSLVFYFSSAFPPNILNKILINIYESDIFYRACLAILQSRIQNLNDLSVKCSIHLNPKTGFSKEKTLCCIISQFDI